MLHPDHLCSDGALRAGSAGPQSSGESTGGRGWSVRTRSTPKRVSIQCVSTSRDLIRTASRGSALWAGPAPGLQCAARCGAAKPSSGARCSSAKLKGCLPSSFGVEATMPSGREGVSTVSSFDSQTKHILLAGKNFPANTAPHCFHLFSGAHLTAPRHPFARCPQGRRCQEDCRSDEAAHQAWGEKHCVRSNSCMFYDACS